MSDINPDRYIDPRDYQELSGSKIDPTLITLNIKSISGDAVGDALFISPDLSRTNPGRINNSYTKAYSSVMGDGGWLFDGNLSLRTFDSSDFCCFKPRNPRKNKEGKIIKYENPPQIELEIYVPRVSNKIAYGIFQKYGDIAIAPVESLESLLDNPNEECLVFWKWVVTNPLPVVNTEGVKKTLALLSHGHIAFGLAGVTGWNKPTTTEIRDCITPLLAVPRKITFAWDSDKKAVTVAMVNTQKLKFSLALTKSGCTVYNAHWSPILGKGLDDVEDWENIEGAIIGAKISPIFTEDAKSLEGIWDRIKSLPEGRDRSNRITEFLAAISDTVTRDFFREKTKGLGISKQAIDKAVSGLLGRGKDAEPLPQDIGVQLAKQWEKNLYFSDTHQSWLRYEAKDIGVFSPVSEALVLADIQSACLGLDINPNNGFRENVLGTIKVQNHISDWKEPDPIDNIPFLDGLYNVKTGELLEHSPENMLLWTLPRNYDTDSKEYRNTDNWLHELTGGNKRDRAILEAFLAATLRGMSHLQRFLLLTGGGGNGKGVYMNFASILIGAKNVFTASIRDLEKDHRVAELQGKRLAKFDDEETYYGNWQTFKNLTGDSELVGALKFRDSVQFKPTAITMVSANGAIAGGGAGNWYKRRVVHVHTDFKPKVENPDLVSDLEKELPAFTQYLLSLSKEQIKNTIYGKNADSSESGKVSSVFLRDRIGSDSLVAWIDNRLIVEPGCETQLSLSEKYDQSERDKALFADYVQFLKDGQYKGFLNAQMFYKNLKTNLEMLQIPFESGLKNKRGAFIKGIRVRTEGDFDSHPTLLEKALSMEKAGEATGDAGDAPGDSPVTHPVTHSKAIPSIVSDAGDSLTSITYMKEKNISLEETNGTMPPWGKKNTFFSNIYMSDDQESPASPSLPRKGLSSVTSSVTSASPVASPASPVASPASPVASPAPKNWFADLYHYRPNGMGDTKLVRVSALGLSDSPIRVQDDLTGTIYSVKDCDLELTPYLEAVTA